MRFSLSAASATIVLLAATAACGGGGTSGGGPGGGVPPTSPPTSTPTTVPTSAPVAVGNSTGPVRVLEQSSYVDNTIGMPVAGNAVNLENIQPTGATIDGIPCFLDNGNHVPLLIHRHAHLSLYVNGQQIAIPGAIGIYQASSFHDAHFYEDVAQVTGADFNTSCYYFIHTHSPSGIIHIETKDPTITSFTMGDFFAIWGVSLNYATGLTSSSGLYNFSGPARLFMTQEESGAAGSHPVTELTGQDPATIAWGEHVEYTLEIGAPYVATPNYSFGALP